MYRVEENRTGVQCVHIAVAIQSFLWGSGKIDSEVAETVPGGMAENVADGVLLPAGKFYAETWQECPELVLLEAKAVDFRLQLPAETVATGKQRVQSLVGRDGKTKVAGECFQLDKLWREVGIEGKVKWMEHAVGSH